MVAVRVLLVDARDDVALRIRHALERAGYTPTLRRVTTPADVTNAIAENTWDLVLADWPGRCDVAGAAVAVLQAQALDHPLIVVSSTGADADARAALRTGVHDYIPLEHLDRLVPAIERELRAAERRRAARRTEAALRESQRELAILHSNLPGMAYRCRNDPAWTIEFVSQGAFDLTGYAPADLIENHRLAYGALIHPADHATIWDTVQQAVHADQPFVLTYRIRTAHGAEKWVREHGRGIRDATGVLRFLEGVVTDITPQRQSERAFHDREVLFRALFEHSPDAVLLIDPDDPSGMWPIVDCNMAACTMNGYARTELIGMSIDQLNAEPGPVDHESYLARLECAGTLQDESWHRRKDGTLVPIEFRTTLIHVQDRRLVLGIDRDITERMRAADAQRRSAAYFRALIEHASDIVTVLNGDGTVRYTSPAQQRVLGFVPDARRGTSAFAHIHPDDQPEIDRLFAHLLHHPGVTVGIEARVQHQDGSWRLLEATATNLLHDVAVTGIVVNARDITERKVAETQLAYGAHHDALTGLPNRSLFYVRLTQALGRAEHLPAQRCGVLFLDLDHFKMVNDSLGHQQGDRLLRAVAERLRSAVRPTDTVARLGGDEFAVLLEDLPSLDGATVVAERIKQALLVPIQLGNQTVSVSTSIGITTSPAGFALPDDLVRDADIAMYHAKHLGRACHAVFDPVQRDAVQERVRLEADLRLALSRDELVLYYQPIIALATGQVQGVEALIRWAHPTRGLVPPGVFIPLAEETGLIIPIGEWVLRAACTQVAQWRAVGSRSLYVAVNLAALQLRLTDLPATLAAALAAAGLDASALALELTETQAMAEPARTATVLAAARALGLHGIAIDDFGTGYSSLSYLQQFPVTEVKIDRSFVRNLPADATSAALVQAIIAMAHSLKLTVVAEGVETEPQLQLLRDAGCDAVQGYLFSPPLPPEALAPLVHGSAQGSAPSYGRRVQMAVARGAHGAAAAGGAPTVDTDAPAAHGATGAVLAIVNGRIPKP